MLRSACIALLCEHLPVRGGDRGEWCPAGLAHPTAQQGGKPN